MFSVEGRGSRVTLPCTNYTNELTIENEHVTYICFIINNDAMLRRQQSFPAQRTRVLKLTSTHSI